MHDQDVKTNFVAAAALSALSLRAGAALADEFNTPTAAATVAANCVTGPNMLCDPPRQSSNGTLSRAAAKRDTEIEKWAVLLLELGAAGWVLSRSAREARARRTAPRSPSEFDETSSGFRAP